VDVVADMYLAGSAVAREPEGSAEAWASPELAEAGASAEARASAGSAETRVSAGSAEASALVPQSAARQQKATGVTPAWRSISIAARVLPAAVWAPPSVQERAATLAWPAAVVVMAAVQAMATRPGAEQVAPPTGQAVATRPGAEQVAPPTGQATATRPTAGAVLQAAVVPVPVLERVSGRHSSLAGEAPAPGLAMAHSVAALAPLPATTMQRTQRTEEQIG
jgi:hypothetical protein